MRKLFTKHFLSLFFICSIFSLHSLAQSSILVNLGSATCSDPNAPTFSLTRNPLSTSSSILTLCDLSQQLPDYFNVFIAYNPKDNKIYIDDNRTDTSKVWVLDVGLPGNMICPASIPLTPTYTYSYVPNNFEFDNNGNLWSFNNYDPSTGLCTMNNFDVTNGNILFTKTLLFPALNLPNTLSSGDVTILPNGRMFVVFGAFPSQLYEITNYNGGTDTAIASYLQTMPQNTFGMAYLNGLLEITGTDEVSSCYYYTYDFANNILSAPQPFQNGQSPIDNTSITSALGVTKQLVNATQINSNTADLTYDVFVRNMGNVLLNNINVSDNLATAFGAENVSNVSTSFIQNNAGLTLNSFYNGTTDTFLLNQGQALPNLISNDSNYFFKLQIKCRVTNLNTTTTYYNSAIGTANIGNGLSFIGVSDSSNNGSPAVVDPNNNGNPGDIGENVPTPFNFGSLVPVRFISVNATLVNSTTSIVKWSVATPTVDASKFEVQYSKDGITWTTLKQVNILSANQSNYQYQQINIPSGDLYYRVKEIDNNGYYTYSRVVLLNNNKNGNGGYVIFPNPANNYIEISAPYGINGNSTLQLFDAIGRKLIDNTITNSTTELNTTNLPNGTYLLRIKHNDAITTQKLLIAH